MDCGIVGLPAAGKTTLFNALTGSHASGFVAGGGAAGLKPNLGVAKIPDPRLPLIASFIPTKKVVHATIQFVDIPGVAPGGGAAKLNAFLAHVRQVDALVQVVRCFDDGSGPASIRAAADIDSMDTDMVIADMAVLEGALDKAQRTARTGDADAKARVAALDKCSRMLDEGKALRTGQWTDAERTVLRTYGLITAKPVLYVANVAESDLQWQSPHAQEVLQHAQRGGGQAVVLCAKLEAELAEIDDEAERTDMLKSMGLVEPAIGPLARAANRLLGLTTFYTAGEKEVRAWPVRIGAHAPEAAGAIHSDIERGFIRAECYSVDDLARHRTEKAIREAGKLRSEGKSYKVQDGDVVHFLFNV